MARRKAFHVEELESRVVPAMFGVPWPDARHLTLSFVSDGTSVEGMSSNLFATMQAEGISTAAWQTEILRAVETWAENANVNMGVVADSGDPLGAPGAPEGDPRFGDIRVAAAPLSSNVLAITTPPGYLGSTLVGDIIINSNVDFSIGGGGSSYDLYSAMLQETGHALGIANSTDPNSPMFEDYSGVRTGLTAGDIANIQALYGARSPDAFEGFGGNGTMATARDITGLGIFSNFASPVLTADITTPTDVDYYKLRLFGANPNGLEVQLNAGMSLLAPTISILDASGNVLSTAQSTDPASGVLTVSVPAGPANGYYYVQVAAANPSFSVGAYQLTIITNPAAPLLQLTDSGAAPFNDNHTDDTINTATRLTATAGRAADTNYSELAVIQDASDLDYYRVRSPQTTAGQPNELLVTVRALDPTALAPVVQVYDKYQQLVAATVLANDDGVYTVQVPNAAPNQTYYIEVAGQNGSTGTYQLNADFHSQLVNLQQLATGTLSANSNVNYTTLTSTGSQVTYFVLSATSAPAGATAGVRMGIFDANGHMVGTLFARAGQTVTASIYLAPGEYTIRFEGLTPAGVLLPTLGYALQGLTLTDPIDPVSLDPALDGSGVAPTPDVEVVQLPDDFYMALSLDWLGDVIW